MRRLQVVLDNEDYDKLMLKATEKRLKISQIARVYITDGINYDK